MTTFPIDPRFLWALGSAATVPVGPGGAFFLPHVGSSPAIVDCRPMTGQRLARTATVPTSAAALPRTALSVGDQMRELLAALSLNKSQLATVLRVTRPTLYDWIDDKEPSASNAERIDTLLRLLSRAGVSGANPLNARFVRQADEPGGSSLVDELSREELDEARITALLESARRNTDHARASRLARENKKKARGFEPVDDEQARRNLAVNVARQDWPKT